MTIRTFVDKNGNSWEWVETQETVDALKNLHSGNYKGPLYSSHPDLNSSKDE